MGVKIYFNNHSLEFLCLYCVIYHTICEKIRCLKKPFINTSGRKKIIGIKDLTCTFECIITYYSKCIALDWNECKKIKAYWEWKNENEYWIFDTSLQIRQIWNEICLCENKFTYNTPYILFNSLCTQSKSYFGHIKNSNSKRESVNIYHVTLTLLKVQFLSCVLLKCWENCIEEILIGFFSRWN